MASILLPRPEIRITMFFMARIVAAPIHAALQMAIAAGVITPGAARRLVE